jgi:hypothetical protein
LEGKLRELSPEDVHAVATKYLSSPAVITVVTPRPDALAKEAVVTPPADTPPAAEPLDVPSEQPQEQP